MKPTLCQKTLNNKGIPREINSDKNMLLNNCKKFTDRIEKNRKMGLLRNGAVRLAKEPEYVSDKRPNVV